MALLLDSALAASPRLCRRSRAPAGPAHPEGARGAHPGASRGRRDDRHKRRARRRSRSHLRAQRGGRAGLRFGLARRARESRARAQAHGDEWHFALHGGEDYELLFTVPSSEAEEIAERIRGETGTPVAVIGEVLPAERGAELELPDGKSSRSLLRAGTTLKRRREGTR